MIAVLSKPADQIGVSDLNELIDSEVPRKRSDRVQGNPVDQRRVSRQMDNSQG